MRCLLILLLFASCMTPAKVAKWNDTHKQEAATYCAETFPCITGPADTTFIPGDSTEYLNLLDELLQTSVELNRINDSLLQELHNDPECVKYYSTIQKLHQENARLQKKMADQKPIVNTIEIKSYVLDTAALVACRMAYDGLSERSQSLEKINAEQKGNLKIRFWMLIAAGAIILLLAFLLFKKK